MRNIGKQFHTATNWTGKEDAILREGYSSGFSAKRISETLTNRTRNSVIGRLHRLGLFAPHKIKQKKSRAVARIMDDKIYSLIKLDESIFQSVEHIPIPVLEATSTQCRWPLPNHHCCGLQKELGSYCAGHAIIAYDTLKSKENVVD